MPKVQIEEPECEPFQFEIDQPIIAIGRVHGNDIILNHRAVSKRHAILQFHVGHATITDLNSRNGIFVNETKVNQSVIVNQDDVVYIADYIISLPCLNSITTEPHQALSSAGRPTEGIASTVARMVKGELLNRPHSPKETQETAIHYKPPTPSAPTLRRMLSEILRTDSDFDAFCLDNFPRVKQKFTSSMDRTARTSTLFECVPQDKIFAVVSKYWPDDDDLSEEIAKLGETRYLTGGNPRSQSG